MDSSPSTPGSEVFRSGNDDPTAGNASPPNSQEAQMTDAVNGQPNFSSDPSQAPMSNGGVSRDDIEHGDAKNSEPGWGWTNKQATEEYARAYDMAVDKDFPEKLQEYGDVLEKSS